MMRKILFALSLLIGLAFVPTHYDAEQGWQVGTSAYAVFPSVRSSNTSDNGNTNINPQPITLPGDCVSGDLMLVFYIQDDDNEANWDNTKFGTWTLIKDIDNTNIHTELHAKVSDGDENDGVLDVTSDNIEMSSHISLCITAGTWRDSGVLTDDVVVSVGVLATTANPDPDELIVPWGVEDTLWGTIFGRRGGSGDTVTVFPLANNQLQHENGGGGGTLSGLSTVEDGSTDTKNPGTYTIDASSTLTVFTWAVRSAAAGGAATAPIRRRRGNE